ncbi:squalene/phytoene synthase family protein [Henriciella sp.]|uniref:squalene/phytoene synthase family protein n=1 Tax=Henriciella sp. TaxID=1968823 RepID=UPI0026356CE3|nr:squalene/phytoene synthase family protein [Henriciella sp.]
MTDSATLTSPEIWANIDERLRSGDEDRWLSSRYAAKPERHALIALYALAYELAKVRLVVSEPALGAIRFQWWRDALEELEMGKTPRAHEVVGAVADMLAEGRYSVDTLQDLVDRFEDAFGDEDRGQQPETLLAQTAASVLDSAHDWQANIADLAPRVAALRRGETAGDIASMPKMPSTLRPALAHFRLRRLYVRRGRPGNLAKRLCVMRAIMSGRV